MKTLVAHNHFPHSALTRYALGGSSKLINDDWKHEEPLLASLDPTSGDHKVDKGVVDALPDTITRDNWDDPKILGKKESVVW
jgi:hypothetical protein